MSFWKGGKWLVIAYAYLGDAVWRTEKLRKVLNVENMKCLNGSQSVGLHCFKWSFSHISPFCNKSYFKLPENFRQFHWTECLDFGVVTSLLEWCGEKSIQWYQLTLGKGKVTLTLLWSSFPAQRSHSSYRMQCIPLEEEQRLQNLCSL